MIQVIYLLALSHKYHGEKENNIKNTCNFDIIRLKQNTIKCIDYGNYEKYCNHYSQPNEFIIHNENGINGENIIIKPSAMWEQTDYGKYKVADFYYTFVCDIKTKSPKLIQHIIPTPQYDINPLIKISILCILLVVLYYCFYDNYNNSFLFGYFCGSSSSHYYCE
jgi:hypothetical protein